MSTSLRRCWKKGSYEKVATREQIEAALARRKAEAKPRGATPEAGGKPKGGTRERIEAALARKKQKAAEEPTFLDNIPLVNIFQDIPDLIEEGWDGPSIQARRKRREKAAKGWVPIAAAAAGGALGAGAGVGGGLLAMTGRAVGAGVGSGLGDAGGQAVTQGGNVDLTQSLTAGAFGALGQPVGEAIGVLAPAAIKTVFRGGEKGRQAMLANIDDAARVGQTPTLAQATQSSMYDGVESLLAKVPGSAGRIRNQAQATTAGVRESLESLAQGGSSRVLDAETAGQAIIGGVDDFVARFQNRAGPLFEKVTASVGADTAVPISKTLSNLRARIAPIAGAERTGERFVHPFIKGLADDLIADAGETGLIPFQALQRVRTLVGEKLSNPGLIPDIPTAQLKQLYGSISDDIFAAAKASGPKAAQDYSRANNFYRAGQQRLQSTLEPLVKNKTPEKVFETLMRGTKSGPTQVRRLMRSLTDEQSRVVTGSVIRRLGTATAGQQGAEGVEFSFQTFLTRWNQIDGKARDELFRRAAFPGLGDDINAIARYAEQVTSSSKAFANPSGTSGATLGGAGILLAGGSSIAAPVFGAGLLTLPLIYGATAGAANVAARMMTSPKLVKWLAQATKIKPNGVSAHLTRLAGISKAQDPETQAAIADYLEMVDAAETAEASPTLPEQAPAMAQEGVEALPGTLAPLAPPLPAQQAGLASSPAIPAPFAPAAPPLPVQRPGPPLPVQRPDLASSPGTFASPGPPLPVRRPARSLPKVISQEPIRPDYSFLDVGGGSAPPTAGANGLGGPQQQNLLDLVLEGNR